MNGGELILAYHGCDATVRDDLVSGRLKSLTPSENPYDWLGDGAYFFESDPERALIFAHASADNPDKLYTKKPIATPAVVGAALCVGSWMDMTTQLGQGLYREGHAALQLIGGPEKQLLNQPADDEDVDVLDRQLDRAVINIVHSIRMNTPAETPPIHAVRSAFNQGEPLAPSSAFCSRTHIQIALREPKCVLGWFLVPGDKLMTAEEYLEAKDLLALKASARTAAKKRVRAPR